MKKRLTLTIDEDLIQRAKRHSQKRGKTLSQTVEDYFALMDAPIEEIAEADLPPKVRSLVGMLAGYYKTGLDGALEERYLYLERKHR